MPKRISVMQKATAIASEELGLTQTKTAQQVGICREKVRDILDDWEAGKENDLLPYVDKIKKRLTIQCLNGATKCFDLKDKDIYKKSSPYQRVGMGSMMIDKALLLTGQATQIVQYEDVDEDRRARYLRLLQERMRTIDVTPTSPQIAPTSPTVAPQDTPEPESSPKPKRAKR